MPPSTTPRTLDSLTHSLGQIAPTWRGEHQGKPQVQPTGFLALNELLPGGGWPVGALMELIPVEDGIGEVRLLLPAARQTCRTKRRVVFINPPFTPDPPALHERGLPLALTLWIAAKSDEDGVWAACQLLREASTGAVLLWSRCNHGRALRKLQLAAETGRSLAFVFRGVEALRQPSPAALRAELRPANGSLAVHVHKARGGHAGTATLTLPKIRL